MYQLKYVYICIHNNNKMKKYRNIQHEISDLMKFGLVDSDYYHGEFTYEGQFISIEYEIDTCGVQIHEDYNDEMEQVLTTEQMNIICSATYQAPESSYELDNPYHDYVY